MQEKIPSLIEDLHGPFKREAIPSHKLKGEGHTFNGEDELYAATEIGFDEEAVTTGKIKVVGEVGLFSDDSGEAAPELELAVVRIGVGDEVHFALTGLDKDSQGRKHSSQKFIRLNPNEPIILGRKGEFPNESDRKGVHGANDLWSGRRFTESNGFSREHLAIVLVDGNVEVKDTSKTGVSIKTNETWQEQTVEELQGPELEQADEEVEESAVEGNKEQVVRNNEAVKAFLESVNELSDVRFLLDGLTSGHGQWQKELLLSSRIGLTDTKDSIDNIRLLFRNYDLNQLQELYPKINGLISNARDGASGCVESATRAREHGESQQTTQSLAVFTSKLLRAVNEAAEPENHTLSLVGPVGNNFIKSLDQLEAATRAFNQSTYDVEGKLNIVLSNIEGVLRSGQVTQEVVLQIEGMLRGASSTIESSIGINHEATNKADEFVNTSMSMIDTIEELKRHYEG